MNFNIIYLYITIGIVFAVFLDDQFSGTNHPRGRYIRLFVITLLSLCFFDPLDKKKLYGGGSTLAAQNFQTGVSPF